MIVFRVYVNLPLGTVNSLVLEMFPFLNGCFAYRLLASFCRCQTIWHDMHINLSSRNRQGIADTHPIQQTTLVGITWNNEDWPSEVWNINSHQINSAIFQINISLLAGIRLNNLFPSLPGRSIHPKRWRAGANPGCWKSFDPGKQLCHCHSMSQHTVRETVTVHSIS
jgi:hypothetical protein